MSAPVIIRKITACLLLAVFAFGITPKRTLHNLIASHKDGRAAAINASCDDTVLSKAVFNCQCDNLVVESPFLPQVAEITTLLPVHIAFHAPGDIQAGVTGASSLISLRGPPVLG